MNMRRLSRNCINYYRYSKRYLNGEVITFGMPTLSPTMVNGKLIKLLVKEGETVQSYQHFITISTSTLLKIPNSNSSNDNNTELEIEIMEDEYYVAKYLINTNDTVPVNEPIALLCEHKDDIAEVKTLSKEMYEQLRRCQWQGYLKVK